MLHAKFQDHRTSGSGEETSCEISHLYKLSFPLSRRLHMKFGFDWPSGFREEDLCKWWSYTCT